MNEFMKIAKELSEENLETNNGGPFGAVVVKDGKVVGRGNNLVLKTNDPTAHAEIIAIREACKTINSYDLSECEIYTSCYPCPMCLSAIIWSNIKKVYYGNIKEDADSIGFRDDKIYDFFSNKDKKEKEKENENILKMESMDREETIKVFNKFKEKQDKTIY